MNIRNYVYGIDLGGTTTKMGLFTTDGNLIEKWSIHTDTRQKGSNILNNIAASIIDNMRSHSLTAFDIKGAGIGVPGPVLDERYVIPCVNLNHWGGFDVAHELSKRIGTVVRVENDANLAALGETWQGSAKGFQSLVFITLGTGVGSGIVMDNKIISGKHGAGGEIGHMCVYPNSNRQCSCGNKGCLEQYSSASGLVKSAMEAILNSTESSSLRNNLPLSAKKIFDHAKANDCLANQLVDNFSEMLGRALAMVACVFDPEIVVIGGGVSAAGEFLLEKVRKSFIQHAFPGCVHTEFRLASLLNDAGIFGGANLALSTSPAVCKVKPTRLPLA